MNHGFRQVAWRRPAGKAVPGLRALLPGGIAAWLLAGLLAWDAARSALGEPPVVPQGLASWGSSQAAASRAVTVDDVALRPDGVLLGRAVSLGDGTLRRGMPGAWIVLRNQSQIVAQTVTDAEGRFAVPHLSGGVYELALGTPQGMRSRYCRVWTASAAPPNALAEIELTDNGRNSPLVRGQSPFPVATIGRVATVVGIAAGAIAVPILYNQKETTSIPASP